MRVHELAKATNLESKDVLAIAKKFKVDVKASPSANIEDKDVRKLMPLIERHKAEMKAGEADDKRRKEDDAKRRDEERRVKDDERRRESETKKVQDDVERKKAEDATRVEAQRRTDEERKAKQEADKARREGMERLRQEDERLRSLGLPIPPRPAGYLPPPVPPVSAAPAPPPRPPAAPRAPMAPRMPIQPGAGTGFRSAPPAPPRPPVMPGAATAAPPAAAPPAGAGAAAAAAAAPAPAGSGAPVVPASSPAAPAAAPRPAPGAGAPAFPPRLPMPSGGPRPGGGAGMSGGPGFRPSPGPGGPRPQGEYRGPGGPGPGPGAGGMAPPREGYRGPRPDGSSGPGGPRPAPNEYRGTGAPGAGGPRPPSGEYRGPQGPRPTGEYRGPSDRGGPRPPSGEYRGPSGPRPPGEYRGPSDRGPRPPSGEYRGPQGPRPPGEYRGPSDRTGGPGGERRGPGGPPRGDRPAGERGPRPNLESGILPTIGVMRLDKPAAARGARAPERGKKPGAPGAGGSPEARRGKVAPRKIFELDEDMTQTARPKAPGAGPRPRPAGRMGSRKKGPRQSHRQGPVDFNRLPTRHITIEPPVTLARFAEKIGVPPTEIVKRCLMMGEMVAMNHDIKPELMMLLAPDFNVDLEIIDVGDEYDVADHVELDNPENLVRRPPVVTIMGHVDHGKTSLLDYIRDARVAEGEFGGITQHIGAYHVPTPKGEIVFLDTPGHEAFTSMRARGAGVTDLVILVVAANDGFKPQTLEALHHAQAAKVPVVVAVNKVDLAGADPQKVRQEGLQHGLVSEELGGETIFCDVSAKKGTGVEHLLEMVLLQAEVLDLKADPDRRALGTVIESHVDPLRGAVATILVQTGTLKSGDDFVVGDIHGRVRNMRDDRGRSVKSASPSFPVQIIGLSGSPAAGETFSVVPDDVTAREIAETRADRRRHAGLNPVQHRHMSLDNLHNMLADGKTEDLNIVLKADVQGSMEAVTQSLEKLSNSQVRIRILHSAVGGVSDSDVNLAAASDAVIIGFNVRPDATATALAAQEGVELKTYRIIYDLIEEVKAAMTGMLSPTFREKILGHAEVRQLFKASRLGTIAGCRVMDGELVRDCKVRLVRDSVVVYDGVLNSLKIVKDDAKKVPAGRECGLTIENYNDLKEGDVIEAYMMEELAGVLAPAGS